MADDLVVRLKAEDELSDRLKDAQKSVRDLKKELVSAAKEADSTGDYGRVKELEDEFRSASKRVGELRGELKQLQRDSKSTADGTVKNAGQMKSAWSRLQKVMENPLFTAATIAGVTLFGRRAVEAFAEAEQSQLKLVEAYRKFDAIGNVPIESMRELASELQSLTGTDDDLLAAAAGTLARFELTGDAIQRLLPLVNDFAILTGRDVVEASEAIGKAFMGNTRALKELGIDFRATGDRGADFEAILLALEQKAGGAGDAFGATAQGGLARAQAAFSDLQEEIGGALVPALTGLLRVVEPAAKFFSGLPGPIKGTAIAIGVLGAAALAIGSRIAMMITDMKAAGIEATVLKGKMAAAGSFMAGPWGIALAAGTIALTYFLTEQAKASARVDEFASSIDRVTGKLNEAGVALVARTLMQDISEDDWKLLAQVGVTIEDVTAAVIGSEGAWAAYSDRLAAIQGDNRVGSSALYDALGALRNNVAGLREDVADGTRQWEIAERAQQIAQRSTAALSRATDEMTLSQGRVNRVLQEASRIIPNVPLSAYEQAVRDAASATRDADRATDELREGLSLLSGAISTWGAKQNFKQALKTFLEDPTVDAAVAMVSAMESAASSIEDPGERAEFSVTAIGKIKQALKDEGIKLPPAVREAMQGYETDANNTKAAVDRINASLDALERTRRVQVIIETRTSRVPSGGTPDTDNDPTRRHGGWVGGATGGPTSDSVRTWLSRGEYVLRGGAASALHAALGDSGMWALNHADRAMPSFLDAALPPITMDSGGQQPALVGAGAPVINIGEIKADSGIDVQTEVMWALRRAERIKRERG